MRSTNGMEFPFFVWKMACIVVLLYGHKVINIRLDNKKEPVPFGLSKRVRFSEALHHDVREIRVCSNLIVDRVPACREKINRSRFGS